jgi:cytochrome b pre-mRNA-processing protein 3
MALSLNPLAALLPWRRKEPHAEKLYGAIVARTRLPIFYQRFGVPDSLEGRFAVLSLHLFAVLHRLKDASPGATRIAQDLADCFTADMEAVLREFGVGDLSVPKRVRKLVAAGAGQLESFERALGQGEGAFAMAIAGALPHEDGAAAKAASARLTPYVLKVIQDLETQPVQTICAGTLRFPEI